MSVRRPLRGQLLLPSQECIDDRLLVDPKRLCDDLLGLQINAQLGRVLKQIAAGVAVTLGITIDHLLNAECSFGKERFPSCL